MIQSGKGLGRIHLRMFKQLWVVLTHFTRALTNIGLQGYRMPQTVNPKPLNPKPMKTNSRTRTGQTP